MTDCNLRLRKGDRRKIEKFYRRVEREKVKNYNNFPDDFWSIIRGGCGYGASKIRKGIEKNYFDDKNDYFDFCAVSSAYNIPRICYVSTKEGIREDVLNFLRKFGNIKVEYDGYRTMQYTYNGRGIYGDLGEVYMHRYYIDYIDEWNDIIPIAKQFRNKEFLDYTSVV